MTIEKTILTSFYTIDNGKKLYWDIHKEEYIQNYVNISLHLYVFQTPYQDHLLKKIFGFLRLVIFLEKHFF